MNSAIDTSEPMDYKGVAVKHYTTKVVARKLGVHRVTLQNWITEGKVPAPEIQTIGGGSFRLWTGADIARARRAIAKREKE